jgi:hypothetical protein
VKIRLLPNMVYYFASIKNIFHTFQIPLEYGSSIYHLINTFHVAAKKVDRS